MKTPAAPALEAVVHVVSAAPAVSSDLPGVKKMVASYNKKYPGEPVGLRRALGLQRRPVDGRRPEEGLRGRQPHPTGRGQGAPLAEERRHRPRHPAELHPGDRAGQPVHLRAEARRQGGRRPGRRGGGPQGARRRRVPGRTRLTEVGGRQLDCPAVALTAT
ncbi:hypothetical protein LV779_25895 [Streptomyces thinghirensis]|nr:hypothetical protein [Streptomyces thinghirensis]